MLMTKPNIFLKLTLSVALVAVGVNSLVGPAEAMPEMMKKMMSNKFNSADKNGDGELTLAEAEAGGMPDKVLEVFGLIDTNKSSSISLSEMIAAFDSGTINR